MAQVKQVGSWADAHPCDVLPVSVGFAVSYLDGALAGEHPEIKRMWQAVREHMLRDAVQQRKDGK